MALEQRETRTRDTRRAPIMKSLSDEHINDSSEDLPERFVLEDEQHPETLSKRGRGRPKGAKNKRSPTPEGHIPPEERYFYQNRPGPPQVSKIIL